VIGGRRIVSGEMHYARMAREHWRPRLQMAHAMGLDAISTYVFWNLHEPSPGVYDFSGEKDVAGYVREAAALGLDVILRPGPYVCAEWDFGGLPAWLLAIPDLRLRSADASFMTPATRWLRRLGEELAPLGRDRGGPIVAVQLENEYGAFGSDSNYLLALRRALDDAGFRALPYYTIDQPRDLHRGALPDIAMAATFGPGDAQSGVSALRESRPAAPLACGEYWDGWFDHWGQPHAQRDPDQQVRDLQWMMHNDCSINLYMFCGGTNFGFTNGANESDDRAYEPVTTSYDYLAPLDEAGRPTPKYFAFREAIARATGRAPRPLPSVPQTIEIEPFSFAESASLCDLLRDPVSTAHPQPMESLGMSFGFVLYRTVLATSGSGVLEIEELRDHATILLDGRLSGHLDRRLRQSSTILENHRDGATLDILVENCGRVNYGPYLSDGWKGITRSVSWNGRELLDWQTFRLPLVDVSPLRFDRTPVQAPAFYRARFALSATGDTFLDTSELGKGVLLLNGRHLGRYWRIGPQQSLFVPGAWLRPGVNELIAFDVVPLESPWSRGLSEPLVNGTFGNR